MWRLCSLVVLAAMVSSCGYALAGKGAGALPANIKRIGVPNFQNLTPYPDLDRLFAEAVRTELQSRRRYDVVPDSVGVDAVLTVSVQSLTGVATAFTSDTRQASRYSLTAILKGDFKDVQSGKELWSNPSMRLVEDYDLPNNVGNPNDLAALFVQDRNALERIAKAFAQRLVSAILSNW